ncbi:DEAD-box ATP-dependent RNA helicase 42-like [Humulus lupulus]|uniref:DEAD-box ATP-dependent RNA helicase 42-like n=1 Tax=Humulus lupulus TaxID=3486 RepID=UPI002B41301B|nr:DEAD-box ATP-dependent RNA helicase 42-like [Humulus lupulus]
MEASKRNGERKESEDRDRDKKRGREKRDKANEKERERRSSERGTGKHGPRGESLGKRRSTGEDEQRKVGEEVEKRRKRVREWQEFRRKNEEAGREKLGEENARKVWTLEDEESDVEIDQISNEVRDEMIIDSENSSVPPVLQNGVDGASGDEEIDPLDAYINSMVLPEVEKLNNALHCSIVDDKSIDLKSKDKKIDESSGEKWKKGSNKSLGRIIPGEDSDSDYGDLDNDRAMIEDEDDVEFMKRVKKTKADKLSIVDHSKIEYKPFRKNIYIEVKEISRMTSKEVSAYREELELTTRGKLVPKPVKTWHQMGLTSKILETIKKLKYEKPMPIQVQALPTIMSGRDCIGIAKTGSGKTLAFVLPMLRHIKDQPPVVAGDGPIGLIMAPTRELVQQIHSDIKMFSKVLGLRCVPVYGGSGVAQQISKLKRGAEIVVCTPGRMIDMLCTSNGKITNLRRVTYLVLDEADRMFDMGFEPQISLIIRNIRPDRQTVLFSATFPHQVETLARTLLHKPVEIQVGGRSVVNKDIVQLVEVRPENERFFRLLELLGEWYEKGKILIFVHSQEKCDALFRNLLKHSYPCLSLHGAKDQADRESTISDFKRNVCNLLIATSVAARGLDVKELELVINFHVPDHYEDYVHRVGRTGRAGCKGCAITFISEEDSRYAPYIVKALELSDQTVPGDLKALADSFLQKVNQGLQQPHGSGYVRIGNGFKFNKEEDEMRIAAKKAQAKEHGSEVMSDSEDEDVSEAEFAIDGSASPSKSGTAALVPETKLPVSVNLQHILEKIQADAGPKHYKAELEINDFPQNARWKVTHKVTLGTITEWTGAAITTRGKHFPPGQVAGPGERKLYLFIEGPTEQSVKRAKAEIKRVLEDITSQAVLSLPVGTHPVF